jgi:hypothetical protein
MFMIGQKVTHPDVEGEMEGTGVPGLGSTGINGHSISKNRGESQKLMSCKYYAKVKGKLKKQQKGFPANQLTPVIEEQTPAENEE